MRAPPQMFRLFWISHKNPYLNKATPQKILAKFSSSKNSWNQEFKPKKILRSSLSLEIQSTPWGTYNVHWVWHCFKAGALLWFKSQEVDASSSQRSPSATFGIVKQFQGSIVAFFFQTHQLGKNVRKDTVPALTKFYLPVQNWVIIN